MGHKHGMVDFITRRPWLLTTIEWFLLGVLATSAAIDAATDHGFLMAVNCFCIGVVFATMTLGKLYAMMMSRVADIENDLRMADAMARGAAQVFNDAVNSGRIEVVPIQPFNQGSHDGNGPTRH